MRKKRILGWLVVIGGVVIAANVLIGSPPEPVATAKREPRGESRPAAEHFVALPSRESIGKPRGEPFGPRSWASAARVGPAAPVAAEKPAPPPMPYRIAGQVMHDGSRQVVLAAEDRVITVREGDRLDDLYRVESIRPDGVTLVYIPLDAREQLHVTGTLRLETQAQPAVAAAPEQGSAPPGESRPAQLRWEGPQRVQAGNNFNVALKLTSDQPVRALPLQLSFDAQLLEPVAVRPGGFFADGRFSYRVNPGGSIFVGASGAGAVAADAEFLVVTFRPIRSGDAELKLSSVVLQGAAGRAIAHEPPGAFRTAIVQ